MDVHDWITISTGLIVVGGWFVNSYLNRQHEIIKERRKYRLETLHSFLPVFFTIQEDRMNNTTFAQDLASTRTKFLLYGHDDEIYQYEQLISAIEARSVPAVISAANKTILLVNNRVREELGLERHEINPK